MGGEENVTIREDRGMIEGYLLFQSISGEVSREKSVSKVHGSSSAGKRGCRSRNSRNAAARLSLPFGVIG